MTFSLQFLSALLLDAMFGDPQWYPHPVRIIGVFCSWCERTFRKIFSNLYLAGFVTVVLVLVTTVLFIALIVVSTSALASGFGAIVAVLLLYTTVAARDLLKHSNKVFTELSTGSLEDSRSAVARIVGRDTSGLDRGGIIKACIETVAENMVDGITAPVFYAILASFCSPYLAVSSIGCAAIGAFAYKAINTMDSMIAYKNEQYMQFGWTAAKLDDLVNFIPARMSGICLIVAAFFLQLDYRRAAKIFLRDRLKHSSPNAGHPEAAVAGSLGVQLGGPSIYFGSLVKKPYIGELTRQPVPGDIQKSNNLVVAGTVIFCASFLTIRAIIV